MSAFIVGADHIDALITAARRLSIDHNQATFRWYTVQDGDAVHHHLDHTNEHEVGAMLLTENYRSVNYRYGQSEATPPYTHKPWFPGPDISGASLSDQRQLVVLFKAIHCYEYQCCETPDWEQSSAHDFCRALKALAERSLPGYRDAAGWELRRADAASAPAASN